MQRTGTGTLLFWNVVAGILEKGKQMPKKKPQEPKINCAYSKMVKTIDLKPNPKNPNKHPDSQIDLLARLIKAQGWRAPITVSNRSGMIVRGHGRLEAAQKLKLEKCPVDFQDYKSKSAELADLIADNRLAELASINFELLAATLGDVDEDDRTLTAYPPEKIKEILEQSLPNTDEQLQDVEYKLLVDCENENDQAKLMKQLEKSGREVKPLIL